MKYAKTKPDKGGRIIIPGEFRKALDMRQGEYVVLQLQGEEIRLYTMREAIRRSQERLSEYIPDDRSLVDELIAERRSEAARE